MLAKLPLTISGNRFFFFAIGIILGRQFVGQFVGFDQDPIERPLQRLWKPRVGAVLSDLSGQLNRYDRPLLSYYCFSLPIIPGRKIQHMGAVGHRGAQRLAQLFGKIDKPQRAIDLLLIVV